MNAARVRERDPIFVERDESLNSIVFDVLVFDDFRHLHFKLRHKAVSRRAAEATHALNLLEWDTLAELFTIEAFDKNAFLVFRALSGTVIVARVVDGITLRAAFTKTATSGWYFVVAVDCSLALLQYYELVGKYFF